MRIKQFLSSNTPRPSGRPLLTLGLAVSISVPMLVLLLPPSAAHAKGETARKRDGQLTLLVSLRKQRLDVYDEHGLVTSSPVSSGTSSNPTPTGIFTILQKNRTHYSNLYNSAPMPNMQRITWSGVALHAGALPGYPASHGCIRLPYSFSRTLFSMTSTGNRVIVTHDPVDQQGFAHPQMPAALPPGEPADAAASSSSVRADVTAPQSSLGTVTAMLGVTPAVAAEAAVRQASVELAAAPAAVGAAVAPAAAGTAGGTADGVAAGPQPPQRTRAMARAERQGEINSSAAIMAIADAAHFIEVSAVETADGDLVAAKLALREAGAKLQRLEQQGRKEVAERGQLERNLVDFIKRQHQDAARFEARAARRQADHQADAASNRTTEDLVRRSALRAADAERDATALAAAASQEVALEAALSVRDFESRAADEALASHRVEIERLKKVHDAAVAALPAVRGRLAQARKALEAAKQNHARAVASLAQFEKPATVFVSGKTGTLHIRQGYEDVFQAPVSIAKPEVPLGTHVYTAVRYRDGSETNLDWRVVTVDGAAVAPAAAPRPSKKSRIAASEADAALRQGRAAVTPSQALERLQMSPEARMRISELLKPGSTIIISDAGISNETGKFTDIIVQPR